MIDGTGIDAFEQQFADFNHRVTALRAAREDSPDVLDAVFLELELAQEELRVMHEEVAEQSQEVSRRSDAVDHDRAMLRAVFGELPLPVFVLDDGGFIRRANGAAAELLGTSTAYMAGNRSRPSWTWPPGPASGHSCRPSRAAQARRPSVQWSWPASGGCGRALARPEGEGEWEGQAPGTWPSRCRRAGSSRA